MSSDTAGVMAPPTPLRVLCLDIEGGYGGSSRSLYHALRYLDPARVAVEVWCKKEGPIQEKYRDLGIPCRVEPLLPKTTALPTLTRNCYVFARHLLEQMKAGPFLRRLRDEARGRFDLVHLNHESLFALAWRLRRAAVAPLTMHIRTRPVDTPFARFQMRCIARQADRLVFITENEAEHFLQLAGSAPGEVIYNIVEPSAPGIEAHPGIPADGRLKVGSLSNFSQERGTDRFLDLARVLQARNRQDVVFVMAGDMGLTPSMPGELGRAARQGLDFVGLVRAAGLARYFCFLGHVRDPERVVLGCDVLCRPSRNASPWGRDVLEALASGRPVLATGTYGVFVEHGTTGFLYPQYDPGAMVDDMLALAGNPAWLKALGENAKARGAALCSGPENAGRLASFWENIVRASGRRK